MPSTSTMFSVFVKSVRSISGRVMLDPRAVAWNKTVAKSGPGSATAQKDQRLSLVQAEGARKNGAWPS